MRFRIFLAAVLLSSTTAFAQNNQSAQAANADDPVVMTIAGVPVTRSEFEYSYNKNNSEGVIDKKSVDEYVPLFINYKLKVQAAIDAHLDTLPSFKHEFLSYRDQQIRPSVINDNDVEKTAREIYRNTQQRIDSLGGMVEAEHILLLVKQRDDKAALDRARTLADSLVTALRGGADFAATAKKYSQDPGSARQGGRLPAIIKGQTVPAFEKALFSLKPGVISDPVQTEYGYHIIKVLSRHNFYPYDSVKTSVRQFIEMRGIRNQIIDNKLDSIAKAQSKLTGDSVTAEDVLDKRLAEMEKGNDNLKYLVKEYHDGLLLFEISNRTVWDKAAKDEEGLERYFKKHKKNYKWSEPRFKGIAYHVKDKNDIKAVRECVEDEPFSKWAEKLRTTFNGDSIIRIRVEKGIFKLGDNSLVDKEIFKKDTTVTPVKDYPFDATFGKKLKAPEELDDVRSLVTSDYQEELESQWVEALRQKYPFSVNKDVLATVNKH